MEKPIIHTMEQGTEEWFAVKLGKMSASKAQEIGNQKAGLVTLTNKLARELFVGHRKKDSYTSYDMERGNRLEPIARMAYEYDQNVVVKEIGCAVIGKYVCVSPDGLVGTDGGIEIKARNEDIHFQLLLDGKVDSKTIWQMNMNMLVLNRKWWDFVSYNPEFKGRSLFIKRFLRDEEKCNKLLRGFEIGENQIKDKLNIVNNLK